MSIFTQATNAIDNNILKPIGNVFDTAVGLVKSTSGKVVDDVTTFFANGTTVVGINVGKIEDMKTAIDGYIEIVQGDINTIKEIDPTMAFQGSEIVPALQANNTAVIDVCTAIVSNLQRFKTMLDQVQKAYEDKDKTNSRMVNENASTQSTKFEGYSYNGGGTQ